MRRTIMLALALAVGATAAALVGASASHGIAATTHPAWFKVGVTAKAVDASVEVRRGISQRGAQARVYVKASIENVGDIVHTGNVTVSVVGPEGYAVTPFHQTLILDHPLALNDVRRGGVGEARRGSAPSVLTALADARTFATTFTGAAAGTYTVTVTAAHVLNANDSAAMRDAEVQKAEAVAKVS